MSTASPLLPLLQIITTGIASIEAKCASISPTATYPSLDDSPTPSSLALQDACAEDARGVVAAAQQLVATLMSPWSVMHTLSFGHIQTVALGVAEAGHVAEILREAGPKGKSVSDIAKHTNLDANKLSHHLRFLTSLHVFKETAPDHFANNRISEILDTGKSAEEILANPEAKYDGAPGFAALTGANADEFLKASAFAVENVTDPKTSGSDEPADSALNRAFGTQVDLFGWYERPENGTRFRRFGNAMGALKWTSPVLGGFDWASLPSGGVIVDVGGGFGGMVVDLAREFPQLKYVSQDRAQVSEQAHTMWKTQGNTDVINETIVFQGHDFFTPQPIKNASAFILRFTLHDWSDPYCIKILKHLRDAATSETKLLVVDALLAYNCSSDGAWSHVPGGEPPVPPAPLLPNWGVAASDVSYVDLLLMQVTNTQQRTLGELAKILDASGWKLERVHRFPPPGFPQAVATPV